MNYLPHLYSHYITDNSYPNSTMWIKSRSIITNCTKTFWPPQLKTISAWTLKELSLFCFTTYVTLYFLCGYHIINYKFVLVICVCLTTTIRMQTKTHLGLSLLSLLLISIVSESMANGNILIKLLNKWMHSWTNK